MQRSRGGRLEDDVDPDAIAGGGERHQAARHILAVDSKQADAAADTARVRNGDLVDGPTEAPGDAERLP